MTAFALWSALLVVAVLLAIAWPFRGSRKAQGTAPREANLAILQEQHGELERARARGEIDAESFARAAAELESRSREERGRGQAPRAERSLGMASLIAAACVPAVAALVYVVVSEAGKGASPADSTGPLSPGARPASPATGKAPAATVDSLSARVKSKPDDAKAWVALGRALGEAGRFQEASEAFASAQRLLPGNASVLADQADALAMARGRQFAGEPDRLIQAALAADPRHVKALAMAGTSAFERGDFATAVSHWRQLLAVLPPESRHAREVVSRIREAEDRIARSTSLTITGTVTLQGEGAREVGPGEVIYIVAKRTDGRGRPVAVARIRPKSLPASFRMDDGDSLAAGNPLSGFSEIVLEARLARDGRAEPAPGDPRSLPRTVRPGERAIALELRGPD